MLARLGTLAAAVCFLLAAGVAALWVRSRSTTECLCVPGCDSLVVVSYRGRTIWHYQPGFATAFERAWGQGFKWVPACEADWGWDFIIANYDLGWRARGFWKFDGRTPQVKLWVAPNWAMLLLLMLPVAWRVSTAPGRGRRRRARLGPCVHCGYDLRASADRCLECGRPAPPSAGAPNPPPTPAAAGVGGGAGKR